MDRLEKIYENASALLTGGAGSQDGRIVCVGSCNLSSARILQERTGGAVLSVSDNAEQAKSLAAGGILSEYVPDYSGRSMEAYFGLLSQNPIRAVFLVGVLESAENAEEFLGVLRQYLQNQPTAAVICVTNHSRYDIACRTVFSDMDGLQKDTSRNLYNKNKFIATLRSAGFRVAKSNDLYLENGKVSPAMRNTEIFHYLCNLRGTKSWKTQYFIRMLETDVKSVSGKETRPGPFLSVVTRTTGSRLQELKEVLLCLAAQTCQNFEVLVIGHNLESGSEESIKTILHHAPLWIQGKIRFIPVNGGGRSVPLNVGFDHAAGNYITILDDDDLIFSNWVRTFYELAEENNGKILKSVTVRQEYDQVETACSPLSSAAVSGFERDYPEQVDPVQMLHHNQCPGLCLAFPAAVIRTFGFRFNEELNTTEDWDFILRVLPVCGVAASPKITSIYRWWRKGNSSATLHQQKEWSKNYESILDRMDENYLLLPSGSAKKIAFMAGICRGRWNGTSGTGFPIGMSAEEKRAFLRGILNSPFWKLTSFCRKNCKFLKKKPAFPSLNSVTDEQLDSLLQSIFASRSWRYTKWLRKLKSFFKNRVIRR